jgi:hypothetical protein
MVVEEETNDNERSKMNRREKILAERMFVIHCLALAGRCTVVV